MILGGHISNVNRARAPFPSAAALPLRSALQRCDNIRRVVAQSKQETVYKILRERIEQSHYAPSQRLVIDSIAKELGISQVPIREAMRRLEAEGLVLYSANSGPLVAPVSRDQWFQLMEILAILEGYATAAAARHIGPAEIRALRKIKVTMEAALAEFDLPAWTVAHREFHRLIHGRCDNKSLVEQIEHTMQRADRVSLLTFARERGVIIYTLGLKQGRDIIDKHEEIIAALAAHAPASRLERLTRQHVLEPVKQVRRLLARRSSDKSPAELNLLA
jgi:DNA-binding GntR family transcriptional regulator